MESRSAKLVSGCYLLILSLPANYAFSQDDMTKQKPIEIEVQLSNESDAMGFFPNVLEFETGKLYRLSIYNAGKLKHYFSSDMFSQSVFTRKVQIPDTSGKVTAEVKGAIREIEVYPGKTAEWWFVPVKSGRLGDLKCVIPGHAKAGMVGTIVIN